MKTVVVDDIRENCDYLSRILRNYDLTTFTDPIECLAYCRENDFDILIADQKMPVLSGIELIKSLNAGKQDFIGIIISAYTEAEDLIDALNSNLIYKYIVKPFMPAQLLMLVNRAAETLQIQRHNRQLENMLKLENQRLRHSNAVNSSDSRPGLNRIIGDSEFIVRLKEQIINYSPLEQAVLIQGETGTGKELTARALHENSSRFNGPFIAVNCSAISETLLESELFGYEKGAFSGAHQRKTGLISQSDKGILFLDEIGELPLPLQAKLLRVLQFKTFLPVGGVKETKADFRVICATNRNLQQSVEEGLFRQDLLFRINTLQINMLPLREHPQDIPLLVRTLSGEHGLKIPAFSKAAEILFSQYDFPGNIRELENFLWKLHAHFPFQSSGEITIEFLKGVLPELSKRTPISNPPLLPFSGKKDARENLDLNLHLAEVEKRAILTVYERNKQNISQTARALNLSRQGLKNKLKRYEIN